MVSWYPDRWSDTVLNYCPPNAAPRMPSPLVKSTGEIESSGQQKSVGPSMKLVQVPLACINRTVAS